MGGVLAAGLPADGRPVRHVRAADGAVPGRQLLRLRPHRHLSGLPARQLPRDLHQLLDLARLRQHAQVRAIVWAITLFLGFNIAHFLIFHVRSPDHPDDLLSALRHPVLHLRHHPHYRLDPVPRPLRRLQPGRDGARPRIASARFPAVLGLRRRHRLRASLYAADGRPRSPTRCPRSTGRCWRPRAMRAPAAGRRWPTSSFP